MDQVNGAHPVHRPVNHLLYIYRSLWMNEEKANPRRSTASKPVKTAASLDSPSMAGNKVTQV